VCQQRFDLTQTESERSQRDNLLQTQQIKLPILATAVVTLANRLEQAHLIIEMQSPHGYTCDLCKLSNTVRLGGVVHRSSLLKTVYNLT